MECNGTGTSVVTEQDILALNRTGRKGDFNFRARFFWYSDFLVPRKTFYYFLCLQIEEQVRVVVCTRTRLDETAIFLQRGPVKRRQGEKRRRKTGRRPQGLAKGAQGLAKGAQGLAKGAQGLAKGVQGLARGAQGLARTEQAGNEEARIRLEDLTDQLEDFLSRDLGSS